MVIMAIDLGKARTGLAICDKEERLASPIVTIEERSPKKLIEKITEQIMQKNPEELVVGLPKNMDGSEGESAKNAREFAENLAQETGLKVIMQDERGTTITAHNYLSMNDKRGKKRKAVVDSVSAVIILEDYLRLRKNTKGNG